MRSERVVVVGGGLAGLSAAVELVDRGHEVTLIEAAERCGGKLSAWRDEDGDAIEHGMHGWWPNYVNFLDLMRRVGIPGDVLRIADGTIGILPDGTSFDMKPLPVRLPAPIFLAAQFLRSPVTSLADFVSLARAGTGILAFDRHHDYSGLDAYTFRSWLWQRGVSRRMYETFFEPYVRSFAFDSATNISAAAAISSFHLYVVRGQLDVLARWLTGDPDTLVIDPIVRYLEERGGRVVTGIAAERIRLDVRGRAVGVETSAAVPGPSKLEPSDVRHLTRVAQRTIPTQGVLRVATEAGATIEIGREGGRIVAHSAAAEEQTEHSGEELVVDLAADAALVRRARKSDAVEVGRLELSQVPAVGFTSLATTPPLAVGRAGGDLMAVSRVCTHMGCTVEWSENTRAFQCPCHGATFSPDGGVRSGPADRPLERFRTEVEGSELVIVRDRPQTHLLEADQLVIAVDTESCRRLISPELLDYEVFRNLDVLGTTPVVVARLWFPGARLLGDRTSGVLVDYPLLDNFFVLSNLQPTTETATETVLEVQAYLVENEIGLPESELKRLILEDLERAFPGVLPDPRKHVLLRHTALFSHHRAGHDQHRPDVRTPIPNLHLAGDWVGQRPEFWNMERAVATGRHAAQAVVEDLGGVGPAVLPPPTPGLLFRIVTAILRSGAGFARRVGRLFRGDQRREQASETQPPQWKTRVTARATKFPGLPNEQTVALRFRQVTGELLLYGNKVGDKARGRIVIELESLDSGLLRRDSNLRRFFFRVSECRSIAVDIEATLLEHVAASDGGVRVDCRAELSIGGCSHEVRFGASGRLVEEGLCAVWPDDVIEVSARSLGLDVGMLEGLCGAQVADVVEVTFRTALPYRIAPDSDGGLAVATSRPKGQPS